MSCCPIIHWCPIKVDVPAHWCLVFLWFIFCFWPSLLVWRTIWKNNRLIKRLPEWRFSSAANYLIDQNIPQNGDVMIIGNLIQKNDEKYATYQLSDWSKHSLVDYYSWTGPDPRKVIKLFLTVCVCRVYIVKKCLFLFQIDLNESSLKSQWNASKSEMKEEFDFGIKISSYLLLCHHIIFVS